MWETADVNSLLIHTVFVFTQHRTTIENLWYENDRENVCATMSTNVLQLLWVGMFALISATGYLYFGPSHDPANDQYFVVAFVVYVLNVVLTKCWGPLFASSDKKHMGLALFVAILLVFTSGTLLALLVLDSVWPAVYVYSVYMAWTIYIAFFNYQWFVYKPEEKKSTTLVRTHVPRPITKGKNRIRRKLDINF